MTTTINADPIEVSPELSGIGVLGYISADPIVVGPPKLSTSFKHWIYFSNRNPDLDIKWSCDDYDRFGDPERGVLVVTEPTISGYVLNKNLYVDPFEITPEITGTPLVGPVISSDPFELTVTIQGTPIANPVKTNWVRWSKIGDLDFTIGRDNLAGERQMDWAGAIYQAKKLLDKVVVYGVNGISLLFPYESTFGLQTIYRKGLKSQGAWAGTDSVHYFLNAQGCLCTMSDTIVELGYEKFLDPLVDPVLSLDVLNHLLYISDASQGYIYSILDNALGAGFPGLTGMGQQSGVSYVVSPAGFSVPFFELCTGIYDFETRRRKTIRSIEIGVAVTKNLFASIEFRNNHKEAFTNIGWFPVTPEGKVFVTCSGIEFMFRLRAVAYEKFILDYINVEGLIHDFSGGMDSRRNYVD